MQKTDGEPMPAGTDFGEDMAIPGETDPQQLVGAVRLQHLFEATLVGDFVGALGCFTNQSVMRFDTFRQKVELVQPSFHLDLAFLLGLLQPAMQRGQIEGRRATRHAGPLPVGSEQFVVAQGLAGLTGESMEPIEQLLQLVDDLTQLGLIDAVALPQPLQVLTLAIEFGDQFPFDVTASQCIEHFEQMAEHGAGFPRGASMQVMARLAENEFQAQEFADTFVERVFEMHDS